MARLRSLIARGLSAAMLIPVGAGCTGLGKTKADIVTAFRFEKPKPATQMLCFWQRRPQHLPDPSRDGVMAPGLVGQMFLISPDNKPVDVTGDLIVQAIDETKRPPGQPAAMPEIWQIDKAALKKLATKDERFGTCYALFLPWPANWKDVTNVRMQAKYISKPNGDLFASDVAMTLEFAAPGAAWNEPGGAPSAAAKATGPSEMRGIPDLAKAFKNSPGVAAPPTSFAGANPTLPPQPTFLPPPSPTGPLGAPASYTNPGPNGSVITTKVWTDPVPPPAPSLPPQMAGSFAPRVTPLPIQQATFGPPLVLPIQQPTFVQPPMQPLPPALPPETTRPTYPPGPNGGLPAIELPKPGMLQPVVIPRQ